MTYLVCNNFSFVNLFFFRIGQTAFIGVLGYDFADMMTAFNGIVSDFLVIQQHINNAGKIL